MWVYVADGIRLCANESRVSVHVLIDISYTINLIHSIAVFNS